MSITATSIVRDLAVEIPGATRVFEGLGIDYCCGGNHPLTDACSKAGLAVDDVVSKLEIQTIFTAMIALARARFKRSRSSGSGGVLIWSAGGKVLRDAALAGD